MGVVQHNIRPLLADRPVHPRPGPDRVEQLPEQHHLDPARERGGAQGRGDARQTSSQSERSVT
jgi:hypothetical protein